jgi:N,N'-diacetyllegionaminate synthase
MNISIGDKKVGDGQPVFIIAEAGVNHCGQIEIAKKMVDAAKDSCADAIKFQTFITEDHISRYAPLAEYQKSTGVKSQVELVKKLELSWDEFRELSDYAHEKRIIFLSTPFENKSVDFLESLDILAYKIGSGDITNLPLLNYVSKKDKPMIISTGMSTLSDIRNAIKVIKKQGNNKIALTHCTSNYPTAIKNCNLNAIDTLKTKFKVPVGYSDHTKGILVPALAVARGACIIEKHFTLEKNMQGPDHQMSLNPIELKKMVKLVRFTEKALGSSEKKPSDAEFEVMAVARKSIVAKTNLPAGSVLNKSVLTIKRPGIGIQPKDLKKLFGKRLTKAISADELLSWEDIEN